MPSATSNVDASPLAKRARLDRNDSPRPKARRRHGSSRLFAPYRTVGLVSPTAVPFTSIPLGKTTFQITTSVGRAVQTYDLAKGLNLVFVSRPQTPSTITATLAWKQFVLAAWGGQNGHPAGIWIFRRGKKVAELPVPKSHSRPILHLQIFGSWIVAVSDSSALIWNSSTLEHYTSIACMPGSTYTGAVATLPTLLNKILLGKDDGSIELWNVATGKLVHNFVAASIKLGSVTALEAAPALGVVAIGYSGGTVAIHDVMADESVLELFAGGASQGSIPITSIAFRMDGMGAGDDGRKSGVMATASTKSGDITLWDLNRGGKKAGTLRGAHAAPSKGATGGVSKVEFLPGQAVMISSGIDNHLSSWIFDETPFSPVPRLLHSRGGHSAPISRLHFLPSASDGSDMSGKWLLASSQDRALWGWSLRRDGQSSELSQGAIKKKARKSGIMASSGKDFIGNLKAPPVTAMACSLNRDGGIGATPGKLPIWQAPSQGKGQMQRDAESSGATGWESMVTAHEEDSKARTWFWGRKRAGRWAFESGDRTPVTSVAVSPCGTFAVVGSQGGGIDTFNLQSGMHRQRFPPRLTQHQAKQLKIQLLKDGEESVDLDHTPGTQHYYRGLGRHTSPVTGLAVDNLNRTLISCGEDGKVKFWDFRTGSLQHELDWSAKGFSVNGMRLHRSSELVAFSCSDGVIRVIDSTTRKIVRELRVSRDKSNALHRTFITDFTFSSDGRWIIAATLSYVAVWDLPTGHLVDLSKLPSSITALSFSPTAEYLATASADSVGIDVWTNRALYTHVPTRHMSESEIALVIASDPAAAPDPSGSTSTVSHLTHGSSDEELSDFESDADLQITEEEDGLSASLLRLSLVPRSKWQNLLHLDVLRERNKPIAPPTKPESAPFFLPSLRDPLTGQPQQQQAQLPASEAAEQRDLQSAAALDAERSRIMRMDRSAAGRRPFTALLRRATAANGHSSDGALWAEFVECAKGLSPAAADVEIRSLAVVGGAEGAAASDDDDEPVNECVAFVRALCWLLRSRRDFELAQVWMSVFLKVHGDVVVGHDGIRSAVMEWRDLLASERARVQGLVDYCGGMVSYLRAARV